MLVLSALIGWNFKAANQGAQNECRANLRLKFHRLVSWMGKCNLHSMYANQSVSLFKFVWEEKVLFSRLTEKPRTNNLYIIQ